MLWPWGLSLQQWMLASERESARQFEAFSKLPASAMPQEIQVIELACWTHPDDYNRDNVNN